MISILVGLFFCLLCMPVAWVLWGGRVRRSNRAEVLRESEARAAAWELFAQKKLYPDAGPGARDEERDAA